MAGSVRNQVVARLVRAMSKATTGDLQRAAEFLEFAWDVRKGCREQRGKSRRAQLRLKDAPARW